MRRAAWILATLFGLAFLGATLFNSSLVNASRGALSRGALRRETASEPARYHLAAIVPDTDDSFYDGLIEGLSEEVSEVDAALQVFRYPAASSAQAESFFQIALRSRVDGIVMYSSGDEGGYDRAAAARRNGVVFVAIGRDPPLGQPPGFIGSASLRQGLEGGRIIGGALGSAARVGLILPAGLSGPVDEEPLYRGVSASLMPYEGAAIVAVAVARSGILSGEDAAASMLRAYPDINALFCSSSLATLGAAQVVVDANRVGKVLIVGTDETPEILRYIERGVVAASIVQDSRWIGAEAARTFARLKGGQSEIAPVEAGFSVRVAGEGDS